jgi:hypothetical protein
VIDLAKSADQDVKRAVRSVEYAAQGCEEAFEAQDWPGLAAQATMLLGAAGRLTVAAELRYTVQMLAEGTYVLPEKKEG